MLAGTMAMLVLLLSKAITAPPEGAGALSVTVPVEAEPPLTLVGLRVNELSAGKTAGVTVVVDIGIEVGVDVGAFGSDVDVDVGSGDEAPIHNVPITFELL